MIQGQSAQLSEIANHIPGDTHAVGRIARVRRFLASKWIVSRTLYQPLIEESFRDDKSGGFDLEASHLVDPKRLDTLLLALSVAMLWIYELGEQVLRDDRRSEVDPAYKRQLSVFQLGWQLLRRVISGATPPLYTLRLNPFKPEPVWYGKC